MPKIDSSFNPAEYTPVAERIALFYHAYPRGRIATRLLSYHDSRVIVEAAVYRLDADRHPAATGLASEHESDGEINAVACLENTETSAIGRALANLGITGSARRPSREEMEKAERARRALDRAPSPPSAAERPPLHAVREAPAFDWERQHQADAAVRVLRLLSRAEVVGMRPKRVESARAHVSSGYLDRPVLERIEARLRGWIELQSRRAFGLGA